MITNSYIPTETVVTTLKVTDLDSSTALSALSLFIVADLNNVTSEYESKSLSFAALSGAIAELLLPKFDELYNNIVAVAADIAEHKSLTGANDPHSPSFNDASLNVIDKIYPIGSIRWDSSTELLNDENGIIELICDGSVIPNSLTAICTTYISKFGNRVPNLMYGTMIGVGPTQNNIKKYGSSTDLQYKLINGKYYLLSGLNATPGSIPNITGEFAATGQGSGKNLDALFSGAFRKSKFLDDKVHEIGHKGVSVSFNAKRSSTVYSDSNPSNVVPKGEFLVPKIRVK